MSKPKTTYIIEHKPSGEVFSILLLINTKLSGSRNLNEDTESILCSSSHFVDENYKKIDVEKMDNNEITIGSKILVGVDKLEYEVIGID